MIERLERLIRKVRGGTAAQREREALVDVLIRTMYADGRIALPENERLDRLEDELPWESVTPITTYMNSTLARVREALEDEGADRALLASVADRLDGSQIRRTAYDACVELAQSDGDLNPSEAVFLERLRATLLAHE